MSEKNLTTLLRSMQPVLNEGVYVYITLPHGSSLPPNALGMFKESEAITVILPQADAKALGLAYSFECAWISLTVHSSLEAVGLTAAFGAVLAEAGISCNVMAGFYHDHIFVPLRDAKRALEVLEHLSKIAP